MIPVSVIMIAKDEEKNLPQTLSALRDFAEIVLVDGESRDRTREIAEQFKARVFVRPFDHFSNQKNFALGKATQPWVFSLDADELPDEKLIESIRRIVEDPSRKAVAYRTCRKNAQFGRELKMGAQGKDFPLRFFKKAKGRFVHPVHEMVQAEGPVGTLEGSLLHQSSQSVSDYLGKLAHYTGLEAAALKASGKKITFWDWALKPWAQFFYRYFLCLGFLDGFEGFLFHALSSFYLVIKYARALEETSRPAPLRK